MSQSTANNVVAAFSEQHVERLTGISVNRLRYWDRTGFFEPSFADENRRLSYSRVYSFQDVASLRVIAALTDQFNVPLQHLRDVAIELGEMDNSAWVRTTLYVLNKKVIFHDPKSGRQREVVSKQYMIGIPLKTVLSDTKKDVDALSKRGADQIGKIEQRRNVVHNRPVIAGTRIPVSAIKSFHEDGFSVEEIMKEYPALTRADINAAISFEKAA